MLHCVDIILSTSPNNSSISQYITDIYEVIFGTDMWCLLLLLSKSTEAIPNPRLSVLSSAISMFNDSTHCCTVMLEFSQTFKAQFRALNVWHNAKWIHDLNENTYLYY